MEILDAADCLAITSCISLIICVGPQHTWISIFMHLFLLVSKVFAIHFYLLIILFLSKFNIRAYCYEQFAPIVVVLHILQEMPNKSGDNMTSCNLVNGHSQSCLNTLVWPFSPHFFFLLISETNMSWNWTSRGFGRNSVHPARKR